MLFIKKLSKKTLLAFLFLLICKNSIASEKNVCYICYTNELDIILPCEHKLCHTCAKKILDTSKKCPVCRKHFNNYKKTNILSGEKDTKPYSARTTRLTDYEKETYYSKYYASKYPSEQEYTENVYSQNERIYRRDNRSEERYFSHQKDLLDEFFSRIRHGHYDSVLDIVDQIAINARNKHGNTALHIAAQNGNKRLIKLFLRRGANINAQNNTGQTPLHYCFAYEYLDSAQYLIDKGADDTIFNSNGLSCYDGLR